MNLRNKPLSFVALVLTTGLATTLLQSCSGENNPFAEFCGPCGNIENGQLSISGNAQLDGFFAAVAQLKNATVSIKGDFDANILALAKVFGVAGTEVNAELVADLKAAIQAEVSANVEGGLQVVYKAPTCQASVDVAVEAQASCEVAADCEVMVDPGMATLSCQGSCQGSCDAMCTGSLSCAVKAPTVDCEGECEGSCELSAEASCSGTCRGDCMGTCSASDGSGQCAGRCDGMCMGTCELDARAECQGTCHGTCYVDQGSAQCSAEAECSGSCSGGCTGKCEGSFEPPSASADCEASADCQAQAKAQASASLECTPPSLDIDYQFSADADATAQAEFSAKLQELKVRGIAILQGSAQLKALIDGEVNGEVVFNPSPLAGLKTEIQALISAGFEGELDLPVGRLPCVAPAFRDSVDALTDVATDLGGTIQAQAEFATIFTGG